MQIEEVKVWMTIGQNGKFPRLYDVRPLKEDVVECYMAGEKGEKFTIRFQDTRKMKTKRLVKWHVSLLKCAVSVDGTYQLT